MDEYLLSWLLLLYIGGTLTIPLWVPIVKRLTGDCGVFWVSATPLFVAKTRTCSSSPPRRQPPRPKRAISFK